METFFSIVTHTQNFSNVARGEAIRATSNLKFRVRRGKNCDNGAVENIFETNTYQNSTFVPRNPGRNRKVFAGFHRDAEFMRRIFEYSSATSTGLQ